jgi:hypothetical protein
MINVAEVNNLSTYGHDKRSGGEQPVYIRIVALVLCAWWTTCLHTDCWSCFVCLVNNLSTDCWSCFVCLVNNLSTDCCSCYMCVCLFIYLTIFFLSFFLFGVRGVGGWHNTYKNIAQRVGNSHLIKKYNFYSPRINWIWLNDVS